VIFYKCVPVLEILLGMGYNLFASFHFKVGYDYLVWVCFIYLFIKMYCQARLEVLHVNVLMVLYNRLSLTHVKFCTPIAGSNVIIGT